jgi:hypothetical protein
MALALITTLPLAVVQTYPGTFANINIPGLWQASGATAGWESPDGAYMLVSYELFVPPPGKMAVGSPSYTVDENFVVTETYAVEDLPPPSPIVATLAIRQQLTPEEIVALTLNALTDVATRLMIDNSLAIGYVDLSSEEAAQNFAHLVAVGVLTQERADALLAFRPS